MKAFYSDVLYSREYIYNKFNGPLYDRLKAKFDPHGVLPLPRDSFLSLLPALAPAPAAAPAAAAVATAASSSTATTCCDCYCCAVPCILFWTNEAWDVAEATHLRQGPYSLIVSLPSRLAA